MTMTPKQRLLAYAQLVRLPNVFTALADISMAGYATGAVRDYPVAFACVMFSSGYLYSAGMVWNDIFDRAEDAKVRPYRPIPSGRVRVPVVVTSGVMLIAAGLAFALFAEYLTHSKSVTVNPIWVGGLLAPAILLYDGWLKRTPVGPVAMGTCRFLNVLLGLSAHPTFLVADQLPSALHLAAVIGVYIVGVTWFARTEEAASNRRQLIAAAGVMAAALVLAVTVPTHLPEGTSPWYFPYLVVGFGFYTGTAVVAAVRRPEPKQVQTAVKRCILGLIVLDAVLATAFVGLPGMAILLLLPPAMLLGKWVYST